MASSNLTMALLIILCVDAVLFLGQIAILEINPNGPSFLNYQDSFLQSFDAGNYTIDQSLNGSKIPESEASINPTTGNIFTDLFTTVKSWIFQIPGINYIIAITGGPVTYLGYLRAPTPFTFAIGVIWYGLTLYLIVAGLLIGRNT